MRLSMSKMGVRLVAAVLLAVAAISFPALERASAQVAQAVNVDYAYDALGRLVSETYYTGSGATKVIIKTITYSYDNAGNITTNTVTCGSSGC